MSRQRINKVSAATDCKNRVRAAREALPEGVGELSIIDYVTQQAPELDKLTNLGRWKNAWSGRVADPELTRLIEQASTYFQEQQLRATSRIKRQKIQRDDD